MKRNYFPFLALLLFAVIAGAQVSPPPSNAPGSTPPPQAANGLAQGTILSVELSKSIDAKKAKINDKFEARTAMDLLAHGQVLLPRNTKIIGHITEAKAHSNQSPDSVVGIVFDRAITKDGRELPLQAAVQAVARPLQLSPALSADDQMGGTPPSPGQRGSRVGSAASQVPSANGYPPSGVSGLPQESAGEPAQGSSVSPLGPTSKGVVGIKGLSLDSSGPASVLSSKTENVHLNGGTQLILRVQ